MDGRANEPRGFDGAILHVARPWEIANEAKSICMLLRVLNEALLFYFLVFHGRVEPRDEGRSGG